MENASKALIMAGGMLIALMIIGALLLMFNSLSNYQGSKTQNNREAQIVEFNNQYETYNRPNVRGSDLYSLILRVIDYNRRKSTEGTTGDDQGKYLAYQPMSMEFTIKETTKLTADMADKNRLINRNRKGSKTWKITSTKNEFDDELEGIKTLETEYDKQVIQNLCTGMGKIFIDVNSDTQKKINAIINFNNIVKKAGQQITIANTDESSINAYFSGMVNSHKEKVYQYYEYVQFKRARFDCTGTEYYPETGRIKSIKFEFNEKFE